MLVFKIFLLVVNKKAKEGYLYKRRKTVVLSLVYIPCLSNAFDGAFYMFYVRLITMSLLKRIIVYNCVLMNSSQQIFDRQ